MIEEKCDGANSAISFSPDGDLMLQSRGHFLTGGYRERHYNLLKTWASARSDMFFDLLGSRYILYGEWMYAKHTVYYDALPHYFLEFDILDRETGIFLDTKTRHEMLKGLPVVSVPVLGEGIFETKDQMLKLLGKSNYITENARQRLYDTALEMNLDPEKACAETELSGLMEGLYIKVEENGQVVDRMKFVRSAFLQCMLFSDSHWIDRPIIPNGITKTIEELFC